MISCGGSPRASINLAKAARAYAFIKRRGYVVPEDVRAVAHDVLRHRIGLTYEAEASNVTSEEIVSKIINKVEGKERDEILHRVIERIHHLVLIWRGKPRSHHGQDDDQHHHQQMKVKILLPSYAGTNAFPSVLEAPQLLFIIVVHFLFY